jgi:very-short-patch-repair endonuclease
MASHLIRGQRVNPIKKGLARDLRAGQTVPENLLWQNLRGRQIAGAKFRRQQVIDGFVVDFYCDRARLVIELDGNVHDTRGEYDGDRDQHMLERGLRVLRIRNQEVLENLAGVLKRIEENLIPPTPFSHKEKGE